MISISISSYLSRLNWVIMLFCNLRFITNILSFVDSELLIVASDKSVFSKDWSFQISKDLGLLKLNKYMIFF